jgi:LmbE family N-acetylglucosaminyl deacetylase
MTKSIQVFSPHFDDAVLSCGQHILEWQAAGYQVEVVNVFTEFEATTLSLDSQNSLKDSHIADVHTFKKARTQEDRRALKLLGVEEVTALGMTDGGYREMDGHPVYTSHQLLFSGNIYDSPEWVEQLSQKLRQVMRKDAQVVVPFGVGQHADHLLVRQLIEEVVPRQHLSWYMDIPYAFQVHNWTGKQLRQFFRSARSWRQTSERKVGALEAYGSQIPVLFPLGLWQYPECIISSEAHKFLRH